MNTVSLMLSVMAWRSRVFVFSVVLLDNLVPYRLNAALQLSLIFIARLCRCIILLTSFIVQISRYISAYRLAH